MGPSSKLSKLSREKKEKGIGGAGRATDEGVARVVQGLEEDVMEMGGGKLLARHPR